MEASLLERLGIEKPVRRPLPDPKHIGPQRVRRFAIAVKQRGGAWPERYDLPLKIARRRFDAGTHEMFQHSTKDGWVVQYLVPRRAPTRPRSFFSGVHQGQ